MQHNDRLTTMANQIAAFFGSSPTGGRGQEGGGAKGVADHINKYWEPRMRTQLMDRIRKGETAGLSPLVVEALPDIRLPSTRLEERTTTQAQEHGLT
jgi:formate dehydrogenase subunit delta